MRETVLQHLLVLNDPPYGTERSFNGLRVAHALAKHDAESRVLLCGTCINARGLTEAEIVLGAARSTMDALALATIAADKVLVF